MQKPDGISRRSLLNAGASAFSILQVRKARAASNDRLKAGLGCGGRGTQAVVDLLTGNEHVELAGMADVFEDHLEQSLACAIPSSSPAMPASPWSATASPRR